MNSFILEKLEWCLKNDIKRFNALSGEVAVYGPSFEDLGDYLPTLIMFGKDAIWEKEVDKVIVYLKKNDYIYKDEGKGILKQFTRCYSQTDLVWGLLLACKLKEKYVKEIDGPLMAAYRNFCKGELNFLLLCHIPYTNIRLPRCFRSKVNVMSSEDHGMYIEIFILAYELSNDEKYMEIAKSLAKKLYNSPCFKKNGYLNFYEASTTPSRLLISVMTQFSKRKGEFQLLKQNSNALFGIYALGKYDSYYKKLFFDTINKWVADFFAEDSGVFYTNYNSLTNKRGSDLTVFHFIELLVLSGKISIAKKIADSIIEHQSSETGLLPFYHQKSEQSLRRMGAKLTSSWLDSAVDFGVALIRLHQKTKLECYLDSASKILRGIELFHKKDYGFCAEVNYKTGEVVNPMYSAKMTGLVSKLSLAIEFKDSINDEDHFNYILLQDR